MAWRSSGTNNDELVTNLRRFGVISSPAVEEGFRKVDRKFFLTEDLQEDAHSDQPLRDGNIHISAPHIYGSVVEALELTPDSSLSFLNVGSGTGYLSCIAASIMGPRSTHYGVEIHADVVQHCRESIERWKRESPSAQNICHFDIIHGNALHIVSDQGECLVGFDRIYIGAAIDSASLLRLKHLLKPGGVLVGPVEDELVKVVRIQCPNSTPLADQFSQQMLSPVRFTPLIYNPIIQTVIPSRVWNPSVHQYYPDSFRKSCKELLLCSNSKRNQPPKPRVLNDQNLASMLPHALWMEVLSFTHRDWFEPPVSEVEFLRRRLAEEQANTQRANQARLEAESRCHIAERERDVYRLLARRWQSRLNSVLNQRGEEDISEIEDATVAMLLNGRDTATIFGLGGMFRSLRGRVASGGNHSHNFNRGGVHDSSDDDDDDDDNLYNNEDDEQLENNFHRQRSHPNNNNHMEEDEDSDGDSMDEDLDIDLDNHDSVNDHGSDDINDDDDADDSISAASDHDGSPIVPSMDVSPTRMKAIAARPQLRTVSISGPEP